MNLFQRIFKPKKPVQAERIELTGFDPTFTAWTGNAYASDIFREGVDAIARNAGKLKASHILTFKDRSKSEGRSNLNRILQVEPNLFMTAYDFLYKLVTHYYLYNNAFAYIERDGSGVIVGLYPMRVTQVDFFTDPAGEIFVKMYFPNGNSYILPYRDIIHLRRFFNDNDLLGDDNGAIIPALELSHTQNEGIINGIKSGVTLRGLLHFTQIMSPEKLKENQEKFMSDYLTLENSGGVVATDQSMEYTPINNNPVTIDAQQIQETKTKIFNYLGVTEKIVNSSYSDNEWSAFYESTIEPLSVLMSLEFTRKIFSPREQAFGNEIVFESGRLQFKSNTVKIELLKELLPMGMFTLNEAREILNLPRVPEGDIYLQSLNYADTAIVNDYQLQSATGANHIPRKDPEKNPAEDLTNQDADGKKKAGAET